MTEDKKIFSKAQKELDQAAEKCDKFEAEVKAMTMDRANEAPREETEMQTKMSQKDLKNAKEIYLKPKHTIRSQEKFNEKFRADYEFAKEYVQFIAEHKEILGDNILAWTKPFSGIPAEEWDVPTNKPVWGPRYLAEQLKKKYYHRLVMKQDMVTGTDGVGQYFGSMAADTTIQRLDAHPVSPKRSVFMSK